METPSPNAVCPLCGGANACAPAQSGRFDTPCWCRDATFGAELMARIPPAQRGVACLCPACVAAAAPPANAREAGATAIGDGAALRGSRGYDEQADELVARYETIGFADKHALTLPLLPDAPATVLDVGAGSGADAAWLAARGHRVVAVEPTAAMRARAIALHADARIEWVDDSLPALRRVVALGRRFDVVMLSAVWMHLDADERRLAMPVLASLVADGGLLAMRVRHGPVPAGRVMFEVAGDETIALARAQGLRPLLHATTASTQAENVAAGVTWTHLAFRREGGANARVDTPTANAGATP